MTRTKKEWFGKRWTKSFFNFIDRKLFNNDTTEGAGSLGINFCITFTIGIIAGLGGCLIQLFTSQQSRETVVEYVVFGCAAIAIAYIVYAIIRTHKNYDTVGRKIGRIGAVLLVALVGAALGFGIGIGIALLVCAYIVLRIFLFFISDGSTKGEAVLSDGTRLKMTRGICGEEIWESSMGIRYQRNGNTFTRM